MPKARKDSKWGRLSQPIPARPDKLERVIDEAIRFMVEPPDKPGWAPRINFSKFDKAELAIEECYYAIREVPKSRLFYALASDMFEAIRAVFRTWRNKEKARKYYMAFMQWLVDESKTQWVRRVWEGELKRGY